MNLTTRSFFLVSSVALLTIACGDDGDDTTTTTSSTTTSSTTTSTATTGGGGTGTGGMGTGGTTTTGTGGAGGSNPAAAFCADYDTTCGFGATGRFADAATCEGYVDVASAACQTCLIDHLGLASGDANLHCPHACGDSACASACGTSGCQQP